MTERERIVEQWVRITTGEAWHGPSLREVLDGLDARGAALPPAAGTRSVWEIVAHVHVWIVAVRRRLQGESVQPTGAEDWPPLVTVDEAAWRALLERLTADSHALVETLRALPADALERTTPGKDYSLGFMLHGLTQHVGYHAGQIALLRRGATGGERGLLRHTLATLAYRGGKALRGAPESFAGFRPQAGARSAGEILAHLGDLLDWACGLAEGRHEWREQAALDWEPGCRRFHEALTRLDQRLAEPRALGTSAEKLLQGPLADALTHVGQIALLRRLAGGPVRPENYSRADIAIGRVGPEQSAPRREF